MPVTKVLCLTERYQDKTKFTIQDESEWLDDAPDRREDAARILVAAKMDEEQQLSYLEVDQGDPLTNLSWLLDSAGDGAYRFFYIDIPLWTDLIEFPAEVVDADGKITTYAGFTYHNETFYKAKVTNTDVEPGVATGWEDSWDEYDGNFQSEIESDELDVHLHDDISTMEYEECILDKVDAKTDGELCGACCTDQEFINLMKAQFLLDAALSNDWQDKVVRSEVILVQAHKKYCC